MELYLVTGYCTQHGKSITDIVMQAVAGGVDMVQLREKEMSDEEMTILARELHEKLLPTGVPLIINDRVNVAKTIDAEGVHVGQSDMAYAEARKILGQGKIIGLSCENMQQVADANSMDVDYIAVSPVFATPTKTDTAMPFGLKGLREARKISRHKVVAIGGINATNIKEIRDAGADSAALVSAIADSENPMEAASVLKFLIEN